MNIIAVRLGCSGASAMSKNNTIKSLHEKNPSNTKISIEQNNVSFQGATLNNLQRFFRLALQNPFKQKTVFDTLKISEKEQETFIGAAEWLSGNYNILTICRKDLYKEAYAQLGTIQNDCLCPIIAKVLNIHNKNFAVLRADILEKVPHFPEAGPLIYNYAKAEEIKFWLNTNMIFSGIKNSIKDQTEARNKMLGLLNFAGNSGTSKQLSQVIKLYETVLSTIPDGFTGNCLHNTNSQISLKYQLHNKLAIFYNMSGKKDLEQKSINIVTKMQDDWGISDSRNNYPIFDSVFSQWISEAVTYGKNQLQVLHYPEKNPLFSRYGIY